MHLEILRCPSCGGEGKLSKQEKNEISLWHCAYCGAEFTDDSAEREYERLEANLKESLGSMIDAAILREKTERFYNLRSMLWEKIHAKDIDSVAIVNICRDIKKLSPHDFLADFFELANSADERDVAEYVNKIDVYENALFIDVVIEFLLRSITSHYLVPLNLLIERAYRKNNLPKLGEYMTKLEAEAVKVRDDVYETKVPRDVFIAYSSRDIDTVVELIDAIEESGLTCFAAFRNLRHGRDAVDKYETLLCEAIDNCKMVVFVSSKNSRSFSCDAFDIELPYIKQRDLARNPIYSDNYAAMPQNERKPRIEYRLDDHRSFGADAFMKEFFAGLDYCENLEKVVLRIIKYKQQLANPMARVGSTAPIAEAKPAETVNPTETAKTAETVRPVETVNDSGDFVIENGVLKKYNGVGGDVVIPNGVTEIDHSVFCETNITSVIIPEGVTSIGEYAFAHCSSLTSVTIPASVTSIGDSAFWDCGELKNIYITDISKWCSISFGNALSSPFYNEGVSLFLNGKIVTDLVIPDGVTSIGNWAFYFLQNIVSLTISNGVTAIGEYAFANCESLKSVTIPNGVKCIGENAFYCCVALTSVTIPGGVVSIGVSAFSGCSSLTEIFIPDSVTEIGNCAFDGCSELKQVTLPKNIEYIEDYTFHSCSKLVEITIPNSVKVINQGAFWECTGLEYVKFGNALVEIGEFAFEGCSNLRNIVIPQSVQKIGESAFDGCPGYIAKSTNEATSPKPQISANKNDFVIENDVLIKYVGSSENVIIPDGVTKIGTDAFKDCTFIKSLTIPQSIKEFAAITICECESLTDIKVENDHPNYKSIDGVVYSKDGKTFVASPRMKTGVQISSEVTTIGPYAFYGSVISNITIPDNVTAIAGFAFAECSKIIDISLPDSVETVGRHAFCACSSLYVVSLGRGVKTVDAFAFSGCNRLTKLNMYASLEYVGEWAFASSPIESILFQGNKAEWKTTKKIMKDSKLSKKAEAIYWRDVKRF